ncbi:MAG: glycosyltransferase [Gammaproteobacteria bacterium]|nr:glycosyltransferase [Gammaproteobacteria bacterium]
MSQPVILVFARAPVPGTSKTRLIPALGASGAAQLQAQLLARTLDEASKVRDARKVLFADSEESGAWLARRALPTGWQLIVQRGEDLGGRMHEALLAGLATAGAAILIGSDIIDFAAEDLAQGLLALKEGAEVVLGPAADGGYWLVGARVKIPTSLFTGLAWGGAEVYRETCRRCEVLGLRLQQLALRHDIDVPEDLHTHAAQLGALKDPAWWGEPQGDLSPLL